jgi:cysteinyl-tRNA synthetase
MSKSVGNIFQLSAALDRYGRDTVMAYLISGQYRQPLEFSEEALEQAAARVDRIRNFARELPDDTGPDEEDGFLAERRAEFLEALRDDFNTPRALAALFEVIAEGNRRDLPGVRPALEEMLHLLGLESLLSPAEPPDPDAERMMAEREEARAERDFERADRIRDALGERGWEVRDTPEGPRLVRRG